MSLKQTEVDHEGQIEVAESQSNHHQREEITIDHSRTEQNQILAKDTQDTQIEANPSQKQDYKNHGKFFSNTSHLHQQMKNKKMKPMGGGGNPYMMHHKHGQGGAVGAPQQFALKDNSEMLKSINTNKMQHQYIQNLQRANMTLKCKIKEMSVSLTSEHEHPNVPSIDEFIMAESQKMRVGKITEENGRKESEKVMERSEHDDEEDEQDDQEEDQLELKEIGTIEEVSKIRKEEQDRKRREKSRIREKSQRQMSRQRNDRSTHRDQYSHQRDSFLQNHEPQQHHRDPYSHHRGSQKQQERRNPYNENDKRYHDYRDYHPQSGRRYQQTRHQEDRRQEGYQQPRHHEDRRQEEQYEYYYTKGAYERQGYRRYFNPAMYDHTGTPRYQFSKMAFKHGGYRSYVTSMNQDDERRDDYVNSIRKSHPQNSEESLKSLKSGQNGHHQERQVNQAWQYRQRDKRPIKESFDDERSQNFKSNQFHEDRQFLTPNKQQVEKPAVSSVHTSSHTMSGNRDMRPAVYFKDLKKRSIRLEEEKSEHHENLKRDTRQVDKTILHHEKIKVDQRENEAKYMHDGLNKEQYGKVMDYYKSKIQLMQDAIKQEDLKLLSDAIYKIKMNGDSDQQAFVSMGLEPRQSLQPLDQNKMVKERGELTRIKLDLKNLINKAEGLLLQISAVKI